MIWQCGTATLRIGERTLVMGILNVTPDSFSGDGVAGDVERAVARGLRHVEEGADVIDVGGESTRPGAEPVGAAEEIRRVVPVLEALSAATSVPLSVDTRKAEVARAACRAGATIINDISGLRGDRALATVAAETGAGLVLMHMLGTPQTMQNDPRYEDLVGEVCASLRSSLASAHEAGVRPEQTMVDPGFGFGKTAAHNLEILRRLREFRSLDRPILIGASRKSTIGKVLNLPVDDRLEGTAATVVVSIVNGADVIRVHDVRAMARVAKMTDAIVRGA